MTSRNKDANGMERLRSMISQQNCLPTLLTVDRLCKSRGRYNWTIKFPDRSERFQTIEFDPFNDARVDEREGAAQKRQRGRA